MTTSNNNPNRTQYVVDLVGMIASSAKCYLDGIKTPAHINMVLAMCEVAVSLPPVWFTEKERLMIIQVVQEIYGNPHTFLNNLSDESVSFYAKYCAANGLPADGLDRIVASCYHAHQRQFGEVII